MFLFLLLIYFNILPSLCVLYCKLYTYKYELGLSGCMQKHKQFHDCHIHFISFVFTSNLKLNSSIFTDDEGSAEESEDSSSEIVRYEIETKLKCTLEQVSCPCFYVDNIF